jgi:hypothetical protein
VIAPHHFTPLTCSQLLGVLNFFGHWDPTLMFDLPTQTAVTWQLVIGATIVGVGWGGLLGMKWARQARATADLEVTASV